MDRKAQIRRYKQTPRPMGVFRVRNTASARSLVGTSVDLPSMLNRQRFQLESGAHSDRLLQADWDQTSPEAFEFEVLDTLEPLDDPAYDPAADLEMLKTVWVERLVESGEALYGK